MKPKIYKTIPFIQQVIINLINIIKLITHITMKNKNKLIFHIMMKNKVIKQIIYLIINLHKIKLTIPIILKLMRNWINMIK